MSRQAILLSILAAVLVVVAWFFLFFQPKNDEIAEIEEQIDQVQQEQQRLENRIEELREVRSEAPEIEARLAAAESVIPRDPALPSALRQLQLAADDSGVELVSVGPSAPAPAQGEDVPPGLAQLSLSVQIQGGYFQIVDFLRRVEDPTIVARGILWDSVSLSASEYPTLSASLSGRMFARLIPAGAQDQQQGQGEGGEQPEGEGEPTPTPQGGGS